MFERVCWGWERGLRGCLVGGDRGYGGGVVDKLGGRWGILIEFIGEVGSWGRGEGVLLVFVERKEF